MSPVRGLAADPRQLRPCCWQRRSWGRRGGQSLNRQLEQGNPKGLAGMGCGLRAHSPLDSVLQQRQSGQEHAPAWGQPLTLMQAELWELV